MFLLFNFYCFFGVYRCLGRGAVVEYSESGPPAGHRSLFCSVPAAHSTPGYAAGLWSFIGVVPFLFVAQVSAAAPDLYSEIADFSILFGQSL